MDRLRAFKNEKQFQAGVQLLRGMIDAKQCGHFLSDLADIITLKNRLTASRAFTMLLAHTVEQGFAVIALGKLGGRGTFFGSDIDLVIVAVIRPTRSRRRRSPYPRYRL